MILKIKADEEAKRQLKAVCDIVLRARGIEAVDTALLILDAIKLPKKPKKDS